MTREIRQVYRLAIFVFYLSNNCFCYDPGSLWEDLYYNCGSRVSFNCVQTKFINYLNNTLDHDFYITDNIYFIKNKLIDSNNIDELDNRILYRNGRSLEHPVGVVDNDIGNQTTSKNYNPVEDEEKENEEHFSNFVKTVEKIEDDLESQKVDLEIKNSSKLFPGSNSTEFSTNSTINSLPINADNVTKPDNVVIRSIDKVSDIFYDKTSQYLATHDLRLNLPQIFFGGSQLRISPKGFDSDGGVLIKLNVDSQLPRAGGGGGGGGHNTFVGKIFHKVFKKKLLTSFLALLLIIKLIKIKVMYVLPFLIGVNKAKKLLFKALLFLFPPLVHLFKLCTYYHAHASKLHFHHHKVKHHHHHIKVPVPVPVPVPIHKPSHTSYDHYPSSHDEIGYAGSLALPEYPTVESYGHESGNPQEHNEAGYPDSVQPSQGDYYTRNDLSNVQIHGDEFDSWGLKDFYASTESPGVLSAQAQAFSPFSEQNINRFTSNGYNSRISAYPTSAAGSSGYKDPFANYYKKNKNSNGWKSKSQSAQTNVKGTPTVLVAYDPFYSPILQKMDALFTQLGFNDEGCRERLICSMYKNPVRFSPHSNLLSTELSRDPNELERPAYTNAAVIRFYRYVDAARNGQSQKDCLKLYLSCPVKTEK